MLLPIRLWQHIHLTTCLQKGLLFTFKLAAAIQNRVSVTIRALAEALKRRETP